MLTYAVLRDIQKREMESSAIVALQDGFYAEVADFLAKKKEEALHGDSMLPLREYENTRKIFRDVQAKREEKIVLMAIRGESAGSGLTPEEREMLAELSATIARGRERVTAMVGGGRQPARKRVRLLKDMDKYKGMDNAVYGPFREGEEQALPPGEAEWLVQNGMAEPA